MKRRRNSEHKGLPRAVLSADWHIRPDIPKCRTDDFFDAMERKILFIFNLAAINDCPILIAGDLGNQPLNSGWPTWLQTNIISKFLQFPNGVYVIPGQHDLPSHNLDLWEQSGVGVLSAAGTINLLYETQARRMKDFVLHPFPYGEEIENRPVIPEKRNVAMIHHMVVEEKDIFPEQEATRGHQLLKKFPEYDLILSGDNHIPFVVEYEGRLLVNAGSMMRTTAGQIDHKPRVYLWYPESNTVEAVFLPIAEGVVSREHIIEKLDDTAIKARVNAFIQCIDKDVEMEFSFENNVENYFKEFRTQIEVVNKVWEAIK